MKSFMNTRFFNGVWNAACRENAAKYIRRDTQLLFKPTYCTSVIKSAVPKSHEMSDDNIFETVTKHGQPKTILDPCEKLDLSDLGKNLSPTFNLAAYVNKSPTLRKLVDLGVDLYKIEHHIDVAEYLLRLKFNEDIKPVIQFLHDNGVPADMLGKFLTKNPMILKEDLDDLQVRINYLESKKFSKEMISHIISNNPYWLSLPVEKIDGRLGFFQKTFSFTGDEVRQLATALPAIITSKLQDITVKKFVLLEELGFHEKQIKSMILKRPRILAINKKRIIAAYEYAVNIMNIPQDMTYRFPEVIMVNPSILKERHLFLQSVGRAQYNPLLPGYIAPDELVMGDDIAFCENIAKSSIHSYNLFLKTL